MFHVDVTCEDSRVIADYAPNGDMLVHCMDNLSGKEHTLFMKPSDLAFMLLTMLHPSGDSLLDDIQNSDEMTAIGLMKWVNRRLDETFKDCPKECRPIP